MADPTLTPEEDIENGEHDEGGQPTATHEHDEAGSDDDDADDDTNQEDEDEA